MTTRRVTFGRASGSRVGQTVSLTMLMLALAMAVASAAEPGGISMKVTGDWTVAVSLGDGPPRELRVIPPRWVAVDAEQHPSLPMFNARAGGWVKGAQLRQVRAQETTTPYLLEGGSLVVRSGPETNAPAFVKGRDYEADLVWGTIGRLAGGTIGEGQPVYASYRYARLRLDSIIQRRGGRLELRMGDPKPAAPVPPALRTNEIRLANIWLPGMPSRLTEQNLFPVLEVEYPEPPRPSPSVAESLLPATMTKLRTGQRLRVLAWGDSVTDGTYLPRRDRWQEQFVARLRQRFSMAAIELVTEAWGGRNTHSYTNEPAGSLHNYREKVLGAKPDLVISEFVNDAGLTPPQVEERYSQFLADFKAIGAEWIVLTPHYVRPDWMGLDRERDIDQDPRPYVAGLRQFSAAHRVALADAALRYGRLWRQGIPYSTLMLNSINHPDGRGMKLFADALLELFP